MDGAGVSFEGPVADFVPVRTSSGDKTEDGSTCIRSNLDRAYDETFPDDVRIPIRFEPMLPKVYEIMLPSLDAKLNLINVGRRHAALLRHVYGNCRCTHADIMNQKTRLLTAVLTKLLDVNGILERKDTK